MVTGRVMASRSRSPTSCVASGQPGHGSGTRSSGTIDRHQRMVSAESARLRPARRRRAHSRRRDGRRDRSGPGVSTRWADARGRHGQEPGGEVEHAARGPVAERQLVVMWRGGVGQVRPDLVPVGVGPGPGGLGQVAEHGDRARRAPAGRSCGTASASGPGPRRPRCGRRSGVRPPVRNAASSSRARSSTLHAVDDTVAVASAEQQLPLARRRRARRRSARAGRATTAGRARGWWGRPSATACRGAPRTPRTTVSSPSNHASSAPEPGRGAEGAPRLADEAGPQGQPARLVRSRAGRRWRRRGR